MSPSLTPAQAWEPLPPPAWDRAAARHLLRRAGWTAAPEDAERARREGLEATLDRLFPESAELFPPPGAIEEEIAGLAGENESIRLANPGQKRRRQKEIREKSHAALLDMTVAWLDYASRPDNAAFAKWVLFLSDIYVVSFEKVGRASLLYRHFDILGRGALGRAPALTKAVSRSPAMDIYLDLNQNRAGAPNENFARELFELFVLGEGNYTERDIKEAARAFTGYRVRPLAREFFFAPRQHDFGLKTVFGHAGRFTGDDVIDLAYGTPAAGAFVPHEWVKFYLCDDPLPPEYLAVIGAQWQAEGYSLRWLARRLFGSRLFYAPEFRGDFIKSPVQFYLGLTQDLGLSVLPLPRYLVNPLRQMGQVLFIPPNVRGWVGGRAWINSASLAARRTLVERLFSPLREANLNADEAAALARARAAGAGDFIVPEDSLGPWAGLEPEAAAAGLAADLLPHPAGHDFIGTLSAYLAGSGANPAERRRRDKRALMTVLQSPEYQLC